MTYVLETLPPPAPGTKLRILATNDLLGTVLPLPATYGDGGSIAGVIDLLNGQRESLPAIWLDSGDLTVGGASGVFGHQALHELGSLPIAAAAAGNHDLDDGPKILARFASSLSFPLLCADRDIGLPATTVIETPDGSVGAVGITHPFAHLFTQAPPDAKDWSQLIGAHADELRRAGARWVIALLHDGATWWPTEKPAAPVQTRAEALAETTAGWADKVDAILCGHSLCAWTGALHGTPAGQAHAFAASVLPIDLRAHETAMIHQPVRVPPVRPASLTATMTAIDAAAGRLVGESADSWSSRVGAARYLPDLVACAMRAASGADAGFLPADVLFTQAPVDGTVASLRAGPVSELDLIRLFPFEDDRIAVTELQPGEYRRLTRIHDRAADHNNTKTDSLWWNWARAPAGNSPGTEEPLTVAVPAFALPLISTWLERELPAHPSPIGGRHALQKEINR